MRHLTYSKFNTVTKKKKKTKTKTKNPSITFGREFGQKPSNVYGG